MAYVDTTHLSGFGQSSFFSRVKALAPSIAPLIAMPRRPSILAPLITMPLRPTVVKAVDLEPRKPADLAPLVTMPLRTAITLKPPVLTTALRLAKTTISRFPRIWFEQRGIARKIIRDMRAPSGGTYKGMHATVVPSIAPRLRVPIGYFAKVGQRTAITVYFGQSKTPPPGWTFHKYSRLPEMGPTVSLKEPDSIIPLAASREGLTIIDQPAPVQMPVITFKPIEVETLPGEVPEVAKAGLSPIVYLLIAGIALPLLFKKKGKRGRR